VHMYVCVCVCLCTCMFVCVGVCVCVCVLLSCGNNYSIGRKLRHYMQYFKPLFLSYKTGKLLFLQGNNRYVLETVLNT